MRSAGLLGGVAKLVDEFREPIDGVKKLIDGVRESIDGVEMLFYEVGEPIDGVQKLIDEIGRLVWLVIHAKARIQRLEIDTARRDESGLMR